jgi:hypothetical protein
MTYLETASRAIWLMFILTGGSREGAADQERYMLCIIQEVPISHSLLLEFNDGYRATNKYPLYLETLLRFYKKHRTNGCL